VSFPGTAPTLCLLPGLDGTGRLYRPLVEALSADFDVRVIDYPNDTLDGYDELAKVVAAKLPVDRPYVLIAESFAGPLSVLVASVQPKGLRGLVIAASFLQQPVSNAKVFARLLRYLPALMHPPVALLEAVLIGGWKEVPLREQLESVLQDVPLPVLKSRLLAAMRVDARAAFRQVAVPVLYMRATRDRLLRLRVRHDFASAEIIDIEAPHFVFQTVAPQAARCIRRFISEKVISTG